jgi:hypothetical protein
VYLAAGRILGAGSKGDEMSFVRFAVAVFAKNNGAISGGGSCGYNVIAHFYLPGSIQAVMAVGDEYGLITC